MDTDMMMITLTMTRLMMAMTMGALTMTRLMMAMTTGAMADDDDGDV